MKSLDHPVPPPLSGTAISPNLSGQTNADRHGPSSTDDLFLVSDPLTFPWGLPRIEPTVFVVDARPLLDSDPDGSAPSPMIERLRPTDFVVVPRGARPDRRPAMPDVGWVEVPSAMPAATAVAAVQSQLTGCRPDRIGIDSAAAVLTTASKVLVDYIAARCRTESPERSASALYPPLSDGHLTWTGWGGPSESLLTLDDRPWLRLSSEAGGGWRVIAPAAGVSGDGDRAGGGPPVVVHSPVWGLDATALQQPVDGEQPEVVVGVHAMVGRLLPGRADRMEWIARLWRHVAGGGFLAFTLPVEPGPGEVEAEHLDLEPASSGSPDHDRLTEEMLEATDGRILTDEVVVHRPPLDRDVNWMTMILRRLGHGTGSEPLP